MLSKSVQERLNDQIQKETFASRAYLAMATWAEGESLPNIAEFFYNSAEEERQHMLQIFRYINAHGGAAKLDDKGGKIKGSFKNVLDAFRQVLELEQNVSASINEIASWCQQNGEHATYFFLQPFILEQQAAERNIGEILTVIERMGFEPRNLFYLDKQFKKINQQESGE
ncbi:MAG: ferritin [Saprospirales bacterium]|jgi:ferritin|nr:ferritin [Saprospirales bacterium]MBK8922776.1 ferritin [Saprospirales bacterium]